MSNPNQAAAANESASELLQTEHRGAAVYEPQYDTPCCFGPYQLTRFVATGGIAELYKAQSVEGQRPIALKIVRPEHRTAEARARQQEKFGRDVLPWEFEVARRVEHPNVIRVFDCGQADRVDYLAMELYEAPTLGEYLVPGRGESLFPSFAHIVEQSAAALGALHRAGFIHCDVKPRNFLLGPGNEIKLIDFDISSPLIDPRLHRRPKWITASSGFISPEQRAKEPLDERTDIYSLGVLLHIWLTGEMPYAERRSMTAREQNELPLVPMVRRLNANVSEELADLVARMLAENKDDRPRDIPQFLEEFRLLPRFLVAAGAA